jgi:hypothetical protein
MGHNLIPRRLLPGGSPQGLKTDEQKPRSLRSPETLPGSSPYTNTGTDRTQCPGCRICPVVGAAGRGPAWGLLSHPCNHFVIDSRLPASARPPHLCRWSLRFWATVTLPLRKYRSAPSARAAFLIEEPRRRIFCPRLGAAPRAASSHRGHRSPSAGPPSRL